MPLVLELLVLSLASLPKPPQHPLSHSSDFKIAVIIPGHNEEKLIAACVASIRHAGLPTEAIFVIAHNCTDATAARAAAAGATVLPLTDDGTRGKGAALFYGFNEALARGASAVLVVDADSQIAPGLIPAAAAAFAAGADAVQARYIAAGAQATDRTRLLALGLYGFNVLRPRGRANLGLSCGIFGNGFGVSAATLQAIPYTAHSIVEDLEYHLELVRSGRRVHFLDNVQVLGEVPDNNAAASTQRARWEGGRSAMRRKFVPALSREVLTRGRLRLLEPLLDLAALPVGSAVPLLVLGLLPPVGWTRSYAVLGLVSIVLYTAISAWLSGSPAAMARALGSVPKYLLFKLGLARTTRKTSADSAAWVRTDRNE